VKMKRFPCTREAPRSMKIYDSHDKELAELKPVADVINLHDKKNDRLQYTISHKHSDQLSYNLFQDKLLVAEVTPSTTTKHVLNILVPKYGSDLEVCFQNRTDFVVKRNGIEVSKFQMTSDTTGSLDISKGERRNFSFAFMAIFIFWCDEVAQAAAGGKGGEPVTKSQRSKSKSRNISSSRSGRSEEKSKDTDKTISLKSINISEKSEKSEPSDCECSEHSEEDSEESSSNNNTKNQKRSSKSKTPRVISARTSIPLRYTVKSPRGTSNSRKKESSNSVLDALLKKKSGAI